jgi:hypothetical protein
VQVKLAEAEQATHTSVSPHSSRRASSTRIGGRTPSGRRGDCWSGSGTHCGGSEPLGVANRSRRLCFLPPRGASADRHMPPPVQRLRATASANAA